MTQPIQKNIGLIGMKDTTMLDGTTKPKKIISGSFPYVCRTSRIWTAMGYKIVRQKKWSDGKWTFVMERTDDR